MKASKQLNRTILKLGGTVILSVVFLICGAFIFTSDHLYNLIPKGGVEDLKQRAMFDIAFVLIICSGVGILLLNSKIFENGK